MTTRKRTSMIVSLTVVALLVIAGVAWAAGMFPDVDSSDTHAAAIDWAAQNEVVNGYANGNFGPYDPITRGQAASMFKNYDDYLQSTMDGSSDCADCHDASDLISSRKAQWELSVHGTGEAFLRGSSASCAGCHSGGAFSDMVAAGGNPGSVASGDDSVSRQDCRTCHEIHETYTGADWALETTAAVALYAVPGATFDGGKGNLCATCHQPRRVFPAPNASGMITGISSHWGPHHGPQSATMLGVSGADVTDGPVSPHMNVADTCVTCHVGGSASHTFEFVGSQLPDSACAPCHAEVPDIEDIQTETLDRLDVIGDALVAEGVLSSNDEDGHPTVTEAPEDVAIALYNWIYIRHEDKSLGVHNPAYTEKMLTAAEDALGL